jgi:hypothetical protein
MHSNSCNGGFLNTLRFISSVSGHFPHRGINHAGLESALTSCLKHDSVTQTWPLKIPNHQSSTCSSIFLLWLVHRVSWLLESAFSSLCQSHCLWENCFIFAYGFCKETGHPGWAGHLKSGGTWLPLEQAIPYVHRVPRQPPSCEKYAHPSKLKEWTQRHWSTVKVRLWWWPSKVGVWWAQTLKAVAISIMLSSVQVPPPVPQWLSSMGLHPFHGCNLISIGLFKICFLGLVKF